jgi:glycosyltransferase involved in cell wall biosynthesis
MRERLRRITNRLQGYIAGTPPRPQPPTHTDASVEGPSDRRRMLADSVFRLETARETPAICVIACLPPARTGIANSTLTAFGQADFAVDVFAEYDSASQYLEALGDVRLEGTRLSIFFQPSWVAALQLRRYSALVFVLGNSIHNLGAALALKRLREFPIDLPIIIHLHDPCLLALVEDYCKLEGTEFDPTLRSHYTVPEETGSSLADFLAAGVYGLRVFLADLPITAIVVHSIAAERIVAAEMPGIRIEVHPHPLLTVAARRTASRPAFLTLGSFGNFNIEKRTELVVAAFRRLRETAPDARLVLAGYNAGDYADQYDLWPDSSITIHDAPGDTVMAQLMGSVDLAVQLRRQDLGETSGVVTRLLSSGVPVIVSRLGSFAEYDDLVTYIEPEDGEAELAAKILARWRSGASVSPLDQPEGYGAKHFCDLLMRLAMEGRSGKLSDR